MGNVLNDIDHHNRLRDSIEVVSGLRRAWISRGRLAKPSTEHDAEYDGMRVQCYLECSMNPVVDFNRHRETWFAATAPDELHNLIMKV